MIIEVNRGKAAHLRY